MDDSDVDDPAGQKQHYPPVVPGSGKPSPKPDDAGRFKELRANEKGANDRDATDRPRAPNRGDVPAESSDDEADREPSGD